LLRFSTKVSPRTEDHMNDVIVEDNRVSSKLLWTLAQHPFLNGLAEEHLRTLEDCAMAASFEPGKLIFREGDPANRFYLITAGKVALETATERETTVIQTISAGDVLGWSWLFPPYYWHFDARAVEPTRAIFIYGTRLRELCEQNHELGYQIMKRIADVVIKRLVATRRQLINQK
jgi:CRP/FNR family transcriptional regulator, cyclic AMP receptor protein